MRNTSSKFRNFLIATVAAAALALSFAASATRGQASSSNEVDVKPTTLDHDEAAASKVVYRRAYPANNAAGQEMRARQLAERQAAHKNSQAADAQPDGGMVRYPGDVSYQGGTVLETTVSHAVYLRAGGKCPVATCWGDPEGFLTDLGKSGFIHLVDQYVGLQNSDRYTVGFHAKLDYTPPVVPLTDLDIQAVVHAVANASGDVGYGHIYHVFLPPGQDECFDSTFTTCYSPNSPAVFFFCAYHSSVVFADIGEVVYSVEPFQNVPGCQVKPGTPNGQLIDSTNNVLNHEFFEAVSDPDGTAWFDTANVALNGTEIGDSCEFITFVGQTSYFDPSTFKINSHLYAVQPIYSNDVHGCGTAP
jgi:hypothetical protein